ncbi:hypothetical protein [Mycobacteroides abscessus]|uniref:hypothetical protein n=1 Tax=Mycobacteroides abscessus TaxID=36809 RepID=UPI001877F5DF|nr:hypothetical protein [Mycobacteroides abscessus]
MTAPARGIAAQRVRVREERMTGAESQALIPPLWHNGIPLPERKVGHLPSHRRRDIERSTMTMNIPGGGA